MEKTQMRIFIVDDEPSVLRLLQPVVQKTGSACSLTCSAEEAKALCLRLFREKGYSLGQG